MLEIYYYMCATNEFVFRLRYFDDDVESIKQELLANLSSPSLSEEIDKTLKEFERIWSVYRKKLSLRLKQ